MRLIDVADIEKFIRENVCAIGDDHLLLVAGNDGRWQEALPLIKTAYDVDKVVEEFEGAMWLTTNDDGETNKLSIQVVSFDDAIEIVKHGGASDDVSDDVCEWHRVNKRNGE